ASFPPASAAVTSINWYPVSFHSFPALSSSSSSVLSSSRSASSSTHARLSSPAPAGFDSRQINRQAIRRTVKTFPFVLFILSLRFRLLLHAGFRSASQATGTEEILPFPEVRRKCPAFFCLPAVR